MSTIVVMPGGFHPFHAGHAALYNSARRAFPDAEVYVAATNDTSTRPFPFAVKEKLAKLAGVEPGYFVQVKSPFRAEEITSQFNPDVDSLIFVRSEKDKTKPPQAGGNKKDGSPAYLQPLLSAKRLEPFGKHAYMAYLPTVEFGPGMTSATEIRGAWPTLNEKRKTALVMSLYPRTQSNPKLAATVVKLLDTAMGGEQGVAEGSQEINWVKPNFDFEWHEVEEQSRMKQVPVDVRQYYQKHFPNKDAWLKAVQNGKAVVVPPDHAYEIRNAPFDKASLQKVLAPTGHEGPIGPAKEKRVNDLFDKGQVEMPIILKTSQGLWLIGGKTRLGTANYVKGLPAKVWLISGEQGVAEGLDKKEATRRIQKMLNDKYNANLDVDGILGPLTLKSINKFVPKARAGLADEPNKTTAVQGKKVKEQNVAEMDGQNFVGGMTASYQDQENQPIDEDYIDEKWSQKYKSSINCASPKGFSQRAHCAGRKK